MSKAEKEYGWKEAPVIVKGKLTPGIGGGICQVSSTLYNAILEAGLDVVERRNHSLVVHYLPPGLDATFADGYVNFRFRNSTGKQLLIRTVVEDKRLTVKLFGTMPDNVVYRTETEQIKVVAPKVTYVANSKLALGSSDTLQKGEPGYVVDTYRLKYVDGKLVERKKLNRSTYKAQAELVAVNPADPLLHPEGARLPRLHRLRRMKAR
ncbi:VanW family protein [Cohnella faecalis]|uniref:VanW family protein n=1 Tax=Cohnella faecalis TaxID=2315694 RepID=UPI0011C23B34|nr:VanW family protein [Cohnella faecalis]